jgi:hypothetical protein
LAKGNADAGRSELKGLFSDLNVFVSAIFVACIGVNGTQRQSAASLVRRVATPLRVFLFLLPAPVTSTDARKD